MNATCRASWADPLGRQVCCRLDGHDGPHAKSKYPAERPVPAVPEIVPLSQLEANRLAKGARR